MYFDKRFAKLEFDQRRHFHRLDFHIRRGLIHDGYRITVVRLLSARQRDRHVGLRHVLTGRCFIGRN